MATPNLPTYAEYKAMMAEGTELENLGEVLDKKYKLAEAKAEKRYMDELYIQGKSITDADFETYFNEELANIEKRIVEPAMTPGYGDYKELVGGLIPTAPAYNIPPAIEEGEPSVFTALSRQQKASPAAKTVQPAVSIQWDQIEKDMVEGGELDPVDAKANTKAIQKTYDYVLSQNPEADPVDVFETVAEQLQGIANVATREIPMDTSGVVFDAASKDPYIAAFQQQITNGEIPDYDAVQSRFLTNYLKEKDKQFKNENYDDTAQEVTEYITIKSSLGQMQLPKDVVEYIQKTDPRLVPPIYSDKIDAAIREEGPVVKRQKLVKPEKRWRDIDAVLEVRARKNSGSDNWFLDPKKKAMVLADPESFVDQGFFTDESRIGGTRETIGSWALRSALSPLNAVAGFAQEEVLEPAMGVVMGGVAEGLEAVGAIPDLSKTGESYFDPYAAGRKRKQYRAKEQALYENNPVLANIALNKGFTGEGMEISDALNLEGLPKYVIIGGSFAADILDPTFAVTSGVVKGGKNVGKMRAAQNAFGSKPESAYKVFSQTMAEELASDFNAFSPLAKKSLEKTGPFDLRGLMIGDLSKSARSVEVATTAKSWDEYFDVMRTENLLDTPHVRQMEKIADAGEDFNGAVARTIDSIPDRETQTIWREFSERSKFIDDIEQINSIPEAIRLAAESGRTGSKKFIDDLLGPERMTGKDWLNPDEIDRLRKLNNTATSRAVLFRTAPDLTELENVVAVTKNTYAHPAQVEKILTAAKGSEMGQFLDTIATGRVIQRTAPVAAESPLFGGRLAVSQPKITNAFVLDANQQQTLKYFIEADTQMSQGTKTYLLEVIGEDKKTLSDWQNAVQKAELEGKTPPPKPPGYLPFDSYRMLIDRNVDTVARGMEEAVTVRDVELMRTARGTLPEAATKILQPVETRTTSWLNKQAGKLLKYFLQGSEPEWIQSATIQQRQLANSVKQRISALDSQLRGEVRGLMSNEDVQRLYGLSSAPPTRLDAVGVAIVGPKIEGTGTSAMRLADAQLQTVNSVTHWAVSRMFFKVDYVESLTDSIGGINRMFNTNLLNTKGQDLLDQMVFEYSKKVVADPINYVNLFEELLININNQIMKNEYLIKGVSQNQITKMTPEIFAKVEGEIMAGQYYFAKSAGIIDEEVIKLIGETDMSTSSKYVDILDNMANQNLAYFNFSDVAEGLKMSVLKQIDGTVPLGDIKTEIFATLLNSKKTQLAPQYFSDTSTNIAKLMFSDETVPFDAATLRALMVTEMPQTGKLGLSDLWNMMDPLMTRMINDGQQIIARNGLSTNVYGSMDDIMKTVDDMFTKGDQLDMGRILFGEKMYDQLYEELFQGRNKIMSDKLNQVIRKQMGTKSGVESIKRGLNVLSSFRYTALLGMRPRFHGPNLLTANAITYSTVGKLTPNINEGFNVAFKALDPSGSKYFTEAVRTPSGKVYTYGEISDLIYSSGIRSEHDFVQNALADETMVAFLSVGRKGDTVYDRLRRFSGRLGDFTTQEDVMFRASIMIDALREGRSEAEALELAKRSMFDYNDMSKAEKQLAANYFIFYSFTRQNYGTFLKALTEPKKFKRYLDILKFKRGSEMLFSELQGRNYYDNIYLPDYLKSNRAIISVTEGEEYDYYLTSPPIPAIDSMVFVADILEGRFQDLAQKQLLPELKLLAGIEDPFKQSDSVPPEMVNALSVMSDDPNELAQYLQIIVGGKVTPRNATGERGGVTIGNGTYRFDLDQSQQAAYKRFVRSVFGAIVDMTLVGTTAKDYTKLFMTEGTSYQKNNALEQFLSVTGATTPMKGMKPQTTMTSQSYARKRAIEDELRKARRDQKAIEEEILRRELNK